jgi:hypothetical protein
MNADTKVHILYDSIYMSCSSRQIHRDRKQIACLGLQAGENEKCLLTGCGLSIRGDGKNVLEL